jgi:AraC-like DNA-binding protein
MFYPPPVWMERAAEELTGRRGGLPFFPEPIIQDVELASRILTFHHALEDPTARLTRDALMLSVLTRFVARHSAPHSEPKQPSREPAAVRTARAYLEEHSDEDVSLDDLAAMAGLSPFHLVRTFRAATGLPPHAWLDQLRVRHARRLLREGMPIAQVAATAGFADQSHLTRRFKRLVGVTPGQYAAGSKIVQDSAP